MWTWNTLLKTKPLLEKWPSYPFIACHRHILYIKFQQMLGKHAYIILEHSPPKWVAITITVVKSTSIIKTCFVDSCNRRNSTVKKLWWRHQPYLSPFLSGTPPPHLSSSLPVFLSLFVLLVLHLVQKLSGVPKKGSPFVRFFAKK